MSSLRDIAAPIARAWARHRKPAPPSRAFRILLFHDIPDDQWEALEELLQALARADGFITPAQALARLAGEGADDGRTPWLVTFDDGFVSNHVVGLEMLRPMGIEALFFVCPGLMALSGKNQEAAVKANVLRGQRDAPERLMNWHEIEDLLKAGHTIGAHTMTHRNLTGLSGRDLEHEIVASGTEITDKTGRECPWFAYPFGAIGDIDASALSVIAAHYPVCRSGVRGINGQGVDPYAVRAEHVDLGTSLSYRLLAAEGGLDARHGEAAQTLDALAREVRHSLGSQNRIESATN